jgi:hypothetical protein
MGLLAGLRLNCWLAAALPLAAGLVVVLCFAVIAGDQRRSDQQANAAGALAIAARLAGASVDPALVRENDQRWSGIATIAIDGEGESLTILASDGVIAVRDSRPEPQLILALTDNQVWQRPSGGLAAAVPIRDDTGRPVAVLYGEQPALGAVLIPWALGLLALLVALGAGLAWYLVSRIYRPVEGLVAQCEAALKGEAAPAAVASSETASLASAVSQLAEAYVSGSSPAAPASDVEESPKS